ncbi:DEAD/DEAH box helicase [Candidatus Woesearchaeota archaeon]|nr:DEAD/DEAH box helicase [Candidatus Woesearchaeota archaeon]
MDTFERFKFSVDLSKAIGKAGLSKPTYIQEHSIPHVLEGKDVVGESSTGSGKTLAFGCGIIEKTLRNQGLQALVLTPTRELAEQVKNAICQFSEGKGLKIIAIYGGVSISPQISALRTAEVVIATPGRLKDHLQRGTINLSRVSILVLDEADRMLDMGFIDDIEMIIKSCPKKRQTMFFSATIPPEIDKLTRKHMNNPIKVSGVKHVDPKKLKQVYYDVQRGMKFSLLLHLLENETSSLVMVFCNTRRSTEMVVDSLKMNKMDAIAIHGGFAQNKRTKAIESFSKGKVGVLVCTDVAARGLHISGISHIYNYDIPITPVDYVHRIGRTARAGEEGIVVNLLCDYDHDNFSRLLREYKSIFIIEKIAVPTVKRAPIKQSQNTQRGEWSGRKPNNRFAHRGNRSHQHR